MVLLLPLVQELGCGLGTDARQALLDGVLPSELIALDVVPTLWCVLCIYSHESAADACGSTCACMPP